MPYKEFTTLKELNEFEKEIGIEIKEVIPCHVGMSNSMQRYYLVEYSSSIKGNEIGSIIMDDIQEVDENLEPIDKTYLTCPSCAAIKSFFKENNRHPNSEETITMKLDKNHTCKEEGEKQ